MKSSMGPLDLGLIALYFLATLVVGFWRRKQSTEDFLIASRSLGLSVFVATLVATWYGGILGIGEMTYRYGLINWTTQGLPYYVFAVLFALWLAPRVRASSLYTIPDKLAEAYGPVPARIGAVYAFVMTTPAPYVLMAGQIISLLSGWSLLPSLVVGLVFSVIYAYWGGFQSDIRINVLQFILMFGGFAVSLGYIAWRVGGPGWLVHHLPADHLKIDGGLGSGYVLVWFLIALWTLVDPGFHQRCYAARTPQVARNGILVAVGCWVVFDLLTTSLGLYARAAIPGLGERAGLAYPILADQMLPVGLRAAFYVAMLATVMSTVVSYTFLGAMTVGRDLIWPLTATGDHSRIPRYTRVGFVLTSILAIAVALSIPSVVRQWWAIGTIFVPGMLPAVVGAYAPRLRTQSGWAAFAMVVGPAVAATCLGIGWVHGGTTSDMSDSSLFPMGIQPMYPGLAVALTSHALGLVAARRASGAPRLAA